MATEEQTIQDRVEIIGHSTPETTRGGQQLTISNRYVAKLGFWLSKTGSPIGNVFFNIYAVDDDALLASKLLSDASTLTGSLVYYEVTFDSPIYINEEVRIVVTKETDLDTSNYINVAHHHLDVKANENWIRYRNGAWFLTDPTTLEWTYIYTYSGGETEAPSVTIQATTDIAGTTATGNGNVTSLGSPLPTQHGHVWAVHNDPSTADNKTELGAPSATGAFTSNLTGLDQNREYYMRSYIINSLGTFYSSQLAFFTTTSGLALVTTDPLTDVAVTSALGHGKITNNGGSPVTQHGVVWDKSDQSDPVVGGGSGDWGKTEDGATDVIGGFFSLITELTANTEYKMRAYANNDDGVGYGAVLTFTTGIAGTPIVTTQAMSNVQAVSATGNGTMVDLGGSPVTEHGHVWKAITDPHTSPKTTDSKKANTDSISAGDTFSSLVSGLTEGTGYVIAAYAINGQGTSYGSDVFILRGSDDAPATVIAAELKGNVTILGKHFAYTDYFGDQRAVLGGIIKK